MKLPIPAPPVSTGSYEDLIENGRFFDAILPELPNHPSHIISRSTNPEIAKAQILEDAKNTRVIAHERVLPLIDDFLKIKTTFGSSIEPQFYVGMSRETFIERLILKRPLSFMGSTDETLGRDGCMIEDAEKLWPLVGTEEEETPLVLEEYLSYNEMAISALIGVSSPTCFINSGGGRSNLAQPGKSGEYTERGVYIGLVGPRFEVADQMESRFLVSDASICTANRGYGFHGALQTQEQALIQIWRKFYDSVHPETGHHGFPIVSTQRAPKLNFDLYKKRIAVTIETFLLEADTRGIEAETPVHTFLVGLGLGVWQIDRRQPATFIETLLTTIESLSLSSVEVIEVSWIIENWKGKTELNLTSKTQKEIRVIFTRGEPAAKREDNRLLVASYAWDGNAFPGNEYWRGSLSASGDPAAACCSTIAALQNGYINPFARNVFVARNEGHRGLSRY